MKACENLSWISGVAVFFILEGRGQKIFQEGRRGGGSEADPVPLRESALVAASPIPLATSVEETAILYTIGDAYWYRYLMGMWLAVEWILPLVGLLAPPGCGQW